MAKFGEKKDEYSPFNDISSTLASLNDPVPENDVDPAVSDAKETEQIRPSNPSRVGHPEQIEPKPTRQRPPMPEDSSGAVPRSTERVVPAVASKQRVSSASALTSVKRFKTTKDEALRIDRATLNLAAQLGIRMDASKLTRALWEIYLTHEQEILRSVQHAEGITERPPNTDAVALAEFDEQLAELIGEGLMMACMRSRRQ